ncbi:trypsin-like peptidase domain-containing protein [Bifidobacterium sp. ESL0763]|uniref:S1C family serine protease n=1 Tax=Bifidobacterium sp. ESL0763 TaxID=2983227 RepID=UPI0023F9B0FA|nr:trypsin-like peptidase domain-containing protein [Bifidobacterium sp. ESL0763]MDF7663172.1 trypsin-like peptidase domain-containing protein [Bifidobacterium sp. ESL0763]
MAEDNRSEQSGDRPARFEDGAQGAPDAVGGQPARDLGERKADEASANTNPTTNIGAAPTEPIAKDDVDDGPYRPAPQYGAYAPSQPVQNGDADNTDGTNVNGMNGDTQNLSDSQRMSQGMSWNGIFDGLGSAPAGNGNGYGNAGSGYGSAANPADQNPAGEGQASENGANGYEYHDAPRDGFGGQPPYGWGDMGNGNGTNGNFNGGNGANNRGNGSAATGWLAAHRTVVTAVVAAVISAVLVMVVGFVGVSRGWINVPASSSMSGIASNKSGSGTANVKGGQAPDWASVSKQVSDSVVSIQTQVSQGVAKGSGAVIDNQGHIVTNNHVISGGKTIQVTLSNGQIYNADVVGADTTTDLAVIKINNAPSDLKAVSFADSDKLAVGENVMAVGNPLGYDDTATTGIVSALNRPVSVMDDNNSEIVTNAVQIDAAINPGNSGGPTFDAAGQVIGINSSIASASSAQGQSGSIGIGFAIPSDLVKRITDEIVTKGSVKHAMLGVTIKNATAQSDGITRGGAQITSSNGGSAVVKGSPADKAGLKADDTVVAFNGKAVGSSSALLGYVRASSLGDKVTLTIVRGGHTMDVDVTLNQEETQVKGSNRSESQKKDGQSDGGQSDGGNGSGGDGGGLFDPFGLW